MVRRVLISIALITMFYGSIAQLRALKIGDTVPEIKLNVLNYKTASAKFSDFRGKLVILDFWSIWCKACIELFPHLDSMQKKFGDSIVILTVGFESFAEGGIENFLKKSKVANDPMRLPVILQKLNDNTFKNLFPFMGVPHEIWIDKKGVFFAQTDQYPLSENVIAGILHGKVQYLPSKIYDTTLDLYKPLLVNQNGGDDNDFIYRSVITGYNPAIYEDLLYFPDSSKIKVRSSNQTISSLYKRAATGYLYENPLQSDFFQDPFNKRIILETRDSLILKDSFSFSNMDYLQIEHYKRKHKYCYELFSSLPISRKECYHKMVEDLNDFFGLKMYVEKRIIKCLALIRKSTIDKIKTCGKKQSEDMSSDLLELGYVNYPLKHLVSFCNSYLNIPFVVDETGYTGNTDIKIAVKNVNDLKTLNKQLSNFDLILVPVERELPMIVIHDK